MASTPMLDVTNTLRSDFTKKHSILTTQHLKTYQKKAPRRFFCTKMGVVKIGRKRSVFW